MPQSSPSSSFQPSRLRSSAATAQTVWPDPPQSPPTTDQNTSGIRAPPNRRKGPGRLTPGHGQPQQPRRSTRARSKGRHGSKTPAAQARTRQGRGRRTRHRRRKTGRSSGSISHQRPPSTAPLGKKPAAPRREESLKSFRLSGFCMSESKQGGVQRDPGRGACPGPADPQRPQRVGTLQLEGVTGARVRLPTHAGRWRRV
jgi:hypothetical protein